MYSTLRENHNKNCKQQGNKSCKTCFGYKFRLVKNRLHIVKERGRINFNK